MRKSNKNVDLQKTLERFLSENDESKLEWQTCIRCRNHLPRNYRFFDYSTKKYQNNNGFAYVCEFCPTNNYDNLSVENIIEIYNMFIERNEILPPNFWSKQTFYIVMRYLVLDKYKMSIDEIYNKINLKFFKQNRLRENLFDSFVEGIRYCFPEFEFMTWKFAAVPKYFWEDNKNISDAIKWLVESMVSERIISSVDEIPTKIRQKIILNYGLGGMLQSTSGKYNTYELFNLAYPNKWKPLDFLFLKKGFQNGEKEEFKQYVQDIVINKLKYDTRDKILNITQKNFYDNGLAGFIGKFYNHSVTECIIACFPEYELFEWEFIKTTNGFWQDNEKRIKALKELIEVKLKLNIEEVPKVISYKFLEDNFYKFRVCADKHYNSNIYEWVNEVYPSKFKITDFYNLICNDGTKVLSNAELIIHNYLIENYKNVKYVGNDKSELMHNDIEDENYIPDWIVNDNIIIEYFGYYDEKRKNKNKMITDYVEKTHRKMEFYNQYCINNLEYTFIALFPSDFKKFMVGLKQKLKILSEVS